MRRTLQRFCTSTNLKDKEKFNKIQDWWQVGGSAQALWQYNYLRVKYVHDVIGRQQGPDSLSNLRALDVGVGGGILSESLRRLGADVTGLDVSEQSLVTAKGHKSTDPHLKNDPHLNYILTPPEALDQAHNGTFDIITAMEVIEHVQNKEIFLQALARLIKPNGTIFISSMDKTLESYVKMILAAEYITRIVPIGTHQWDLFISAKDLGQLLRKNDLEVINVQGAQYDLMTGEMNPSNDMMQYMLAARKRPV